MTATTYTRSGSAFVASNRLILIVYTVSIFVSALLLFSVQPLFTKMILPRLGGSPAVWSIAMVFFQSLLLFGYAYARTIRNRVIPVIVHLTLLIIALLTLPLAIGESWSSPPESGYALWLLGLFAVTIGLPFFALAANNPLLQAWFVRRPSRGTRSVFCLRLIEHRQLPGTTLLPGAAGADVVASHSKPVVDEWIWIVDRVDRRLRRSTATRTALSDGRERHRRRCRPGRKLGRARALDIPRSGAIRLAYRGLRAQFDRRRRGAVALGASAFDISADLGIGISGPPPVTPSMDVAAATARHCMHHCAA
jgi:hypothetical protein